MIFITLGTSPYQFSRMCAYIDKALKTAHYTKPIIAQIGATTYVFAYKNIRVYKEIPFDLCQTYIKTATIVICHGGAGTVLQCLLHSKHKPFVISRTQKYHEHVDDHQEFFSAFLEKNNKIVTKNLSYYLNHPEKNTKEKKTHILAQSLKKAINNF